MSNLTTIETNNLMQIEGKGSFYSMKCETIEEKKSVFNAINNPDFRISDYINKTINVKDVMVEMVELEQTDETNKPIIDESTGEIQMTTAPRIVLIDDKGKSYQCVSIGIFSALKKIMKLFGYPTWETPLKLSIKQITKGKRSMLTIEML